ncbi:MAG: ShlB/FhaC/HecB family hemolysin secretion/activation protein [Pontixanthobacter sp.]
MKNIRNSLIGGALLALSAVALSTAGQAQPVLDRTDPTQEEERGDAVPQLDNAADPTLTAEQGRDLALDGETFAVGAIVIDGARALTPRDFVDIIQDYSARPVTGEELNTLADRIAGRARERGFVFATATIAPQSLDTGVLRVRLDEGRIDEIRIDGDDDAALRAQLAPLLDGGPATLDRIERQILLADDLAGVYVRRSRFEREGDRGILIVEAFRSRYSGTIELENDGSQPIGPLRARLDFDANALLTPFDELDVTLSTVPLQPEELQFAKASYGMVVNSAGTQITAIGSYSATEPGAYLADRDIFGESWRAEIEISHAVVRSRNISVWAQASAELRDLRQERDGRLARHDRIPVVRASLYSIARVLGGAMRGKITVSQGLDMFGATQEGDPLASRRDAPADFSSLSGWLEWETGLFGDVSLELGGRGQIAATPLLTTEDIGLGGTRFLRGYNFSERTGDNGVMGYGELRYDWVDPFLGIRNFELYAYADGGLADNLEDGRGGGSLASSGGGIRTEITRDLDFDVEVAVPLTGPRYDTDDMSPRFNIRLRQSF